MKTVATIATIHVNQPDHQPDAAYTETTADASWSFGELLLFGVCLFLIMFYRGLQKRLELLEESHSIALSLLQRFATENRPSPALTQFHAACAEAEAQKLADIKIAESEWRATRNPYPPKS